MNGNAALPSIAAITGAVWFCVFLCAGPSALAIELEVVGSIEGPADLVRVRDGLGYVVAGPTLTIYELSDPSSPRREGSYTFPDQIWGFRLDGDRAYVGANFSGLGILDISEAASPRLVGSATTPSQTKIGSRYGDKLAIIDHMEGVVLVDLTNEAAPAAADSFFLDGYARDVVTSGSFAYAVDSPSGLYIFDLSQSGPLDPIGVLYTPSTPHWIEVAKDSEPDRTLLVGAGGGDLQIFDVSDPAAPRKASTFVTPGRAHRAALAGNLAYVADGEQGVQVVDLSDSAKPRLVGSYPSSRSAREVATDGRTVLVVIGERGPGADRSVVILDSR